MKRIHLLLLLPVLVSLFGCNRSPEAAKKRYLESGNKYYSQARYKEASIMYRNALKKDARYGEAWHKLGDTELRRGAINESVQAYRRAIELLPNDPEPASKLADIFLAAYAARKKPDERFIKEANDLAEVLLKRDAKSYHGLRLKGFIAGVEKRNADAIGFLQRAIEVRPKQVDTLFALAQVMNIENRWDESEKLAREVISINKSFAPAYDFLLANYAKNKRADLAEQILKEKAQNNPKSWQYQLQLAGFYYGSQKRPEMEAILQDLLKRQNEFPDARLNVGDFYARIREIPNAEKYYKEGIDAGGPKKNDYRFRMVLLAVAQRKLAEARQLVETIIKEDPKNNNALQMRASLLLQSGNRDELQAAINDLQVLLNRTPQNAVVRFNLARAYMSRSEIDAARVQFEEAVKLRPDFIGAHLGLAQIHLAKRDMGKTLQKVEEVLKLDPTNVYAMVLRNQAHMASGNNKQARLDLEAGLQKIPEQPELELQLAFVNFAEKRYNEAENTFKKIHQKYPNEPRALIGMAEVNLVTGRRDAAVALLREELKKAPERNDLRLALANIAIRSQNLDMAASEFRRLIEMNPKSFELYMQLGETLRRKGDMQGSLEALKMGQQLAPGNPMANLQLALTLEAAGDRNQARPLYENVIKAQPDNAIALNNLAFMLAEEGRDLDTALTYAQRAKARLPENDDVSDTLGWIYIKKNLSDNAIQVFQQLVNRQPGNFAYHYHLAMAYNQKGDKPRARQSLQTALANKPTKEYEARIRELLSKVS